MTDNEILFVRSPKKNDSKIFERNSPNDDVWDDTLLIKAYDKAVQIAQESYMKKKQNADGIVNSKGKKGNDQKWKVGDKCRCQYSEDLKYYEAEIIEILGSTGMCNVRYVGYGNEERIFLKKLKPSKGDPARAKQCREALDEHNNQIGMEVETNVVKNAEKGAQPIQKKSLKKDKHFDKRNSSSVNDSFSSLNFPFPQMTNSVIPPPPPPHMFNRSSEDENETEAMSAMLISWYMSGYHTGYYQGLKMAKKQ